MFVHVDGVKASSSVERKATPVVRVPPLADSRKGQSATERFEVLDARDKEIRKSDQLFRIHLLAN